MCEVNVVKTVFLGEGSSIPLHSVAKLTIPDQKFMKGQSFEIVAPMIISPLDFLDCSVVLNAVPDNGILDLSVSRILCSSVDGLVTKYASGTLMASSGKGFPAYQCDNGLCSVNLGKSYFAFTSIMDLGGIVYQENHLDKVAC